MIYIDGSEVKVGGVVLPGLFKSLEITQDAQIDEETVEGSTSKPKQATGYEDAKITERNSVSAFLKLIILILLGLSLFFGS